jgi:hypothetical protein
MPASLQHGAESLGATGGLRYDDDIAQHPHLLHYPLTLGRAGASSFPDG